MKGVVVGVYHLVIVGVEGKVMKLLDRVCKTLA